MKYFSRNAGYFFREALTVIRLNLLSNLLSILSIGLIFFILSMVASGWRVSTQIVEAVKKEAEINVYFAPDAGGTKAAALAEEIKTIEGVLQSRVVSEQEAYDRMVNILGKEARVLAFFDKNPFSPFIEIKIDLERIDEILAELESMTDIQYIRNNREVLDRIQELSEILSLVGILVLTAVGISTLVIIAHIIRQGIYGNREQINTLRLLGAPESFIAIPFVLVGLVLTVSGGILASLLNMLVLKNLSGQLAGTLPFLPISLGGTMEIEMTFTLLGISMAVGILGSLAGLSAAGGK